MLMSAFLLKFKANYLKKNSWLPQFFFVDSNSPFKGLPLPRGPNMAQKPLYLVGTVLKSYYRAGDWGRGRVVRRQGQHGF